MALTKTQIFELQTHFDSRSKFKNIVNTIQCNRLDSSIFFSYKDRQGNKKYINLPIAPSEIIEMFKQRIDDTEKRIIELTQKEEDIDVVIMNEAHLEKYVEDYRTRYPFTHTSLEDIRETLRNAFFRRREDKHSAEHIPTTDDYHVEVCTDWQDKLYVFQLLTQTDEYLQFEFKEIYKL